MFQRVETQPVSLAAYRQQMRRDLLAEINARAARLRGLRVVHINATPRGGGVAEILRSLVPLGRSVGLETSWYALPPNADFFQITKRIHNELQGQDGQMSEREWRAYRACLEQSAADLARLEADVWVVHDPQPLPLRALVPLRGAAVWRCHVDCSTPLVSAREELLPWIVAYDRAVFSMPVYALPGLPPTQVRIQYPAIDPLTAKNRRMRITTARRILERLSLDPSRPVVSQISRFDRWKNPWQAVDAYRLAKREIPTLQLALVGVFSARDDPEGPRVYGDIRGYIGDDPDVHLFTDPERVGPREINAFQTGSTVVVQRSTREGFGLVVTEAIWKGRPVVATPVGGITSQIQHAQNGFLVETAEACAEAIVRLVGEPALADAVGAAARSTVRERFLLPRLLRDELALYGDLVDVAARDDGRAA